MTRAPTFGAEIDHRRLDASEWNEIYVVGDVHGCRRELDALLARLSPGPDDLVVFVGDLVRKGPDSAGVVERVRSMDNAVAVRGNNEEKLLRGEKRLPELSADDIAWLRRRPAAISWADALVVHGGVDPRLPLERHGLETLQNARSLADDSYERPFWWDVHDGPHRIFFGHTVLERPIEREYAVGLDTGCVHGNALTAYDWHTGRFVAHTPDRTVRERSSDSIVTPAPSATPTPST